METTKRRPRAVSVAPFPDSPIWKAGGVGPSDLSEVISNRGHPVTSVNIRAAFWDGVYPSRARVK